MHTVLVTVLLVLTVLTSSVSAQESRTSDGTLGAAAATVMWGGQIADAATTHAALSTGRFHEANPLLPSSSGKIAVVKVATTAGMHVVLHKLAKKRPKLAKGLAIVVGAAGFTAAALNARTMKRR